MLLSFKEPLSVFTIPSLPLKKNCGTASSFELSLNIFNTSALSLQYEESNNAFSSYANLRINLSAASETAVGYIVSLASNVF